MAVPFSSVRPIKNCVCFFFLHKYSAIKLPVVHILYPPREPVEMKRRKLQDGWEEIFLKPWALHEDIERVRALAEMPPPRQAASGN